MGLRRDGVPCPTGFVPAVNCNQLKKNMLGASVVSLLTIKNARPTLSFDCIWHKKRSVGATKILKDSET